MKSKNYRTESSQKGIEVYYPNGNLIRGIVEEGASICARVWIYDTNENFIKSEFIGRYDNKFQACEAIVKWHKDNKSE